MDTRDARRALARVLCDYAPAADEHEPAVLAAVSPGASPERLAAARWALTELVELPAAEAEPAVAQPPDEAPRTRHSAIHVLAAGAVFALAALVKARRARADSPSSEP